jgi:hypothetical protein
MSTLEIERDLDIDGQVTEAVEIMDCGRVSERTRGLPFQILPELSFPPNDSLLLL